MEQDMTAIIEHYVTRSPESRTAEEQEKFNIEFQLYKSKMAQISAMEDYTADQQLNKICSRENLYRYTYNRMEKLTDEVEARITKDLDGIL